jgi:hypothetical protein
MLHPDILKVLEEVETLSPEPYNSEIDVTVTSAVEQGLYETTTRARKRLNQAVKAGLMTKRKAIGPYNTVCDIFRVKVEETKPTRESKKGE